MLNLHELSKFSRTIRCSTLCPSLAILVMKFSESELEIRPTQNKRGPRPGPAIAALTGFKDLRGDMVLQSHHFLNALKTFVFLITCVSLDPARADRVACEPSFQSNQPVQTVQGIQRTTLTDNSFLAHPAIVRVRTEVDSLVEQTEAVAKIAMASLDNPTDSTQKLMKLLSEVRATEFPKKYLQPDGFPVLWSDSSFELIGMNVTFLDQDPKDSLLIQLNERLPRFLKAYGFHLAFNQPSPHHWQSLYLLRPKKVEQDRRIALLQHAFGRPSENGPFFRPHPRSENARPSDDISEEDRLARLSYGIVPEAVDGTGFWSRHDFLVHRFESLLISHFFWSEFVQLSKAFRMLSDSSTVHTERSTRLHDSSKASDLTAILRTRLMNSLYSAIHDLPDILSAALEPEEVGLSSTQIMKERIRVTLIRIENQLVGWLPTELQYRVPRESLDSLGSMNKRRWLDAVQAVWSDARVPQTLASWDDPLEQFLLVFADQPDQVLKELEDDW